MKNYVISVSTALERRANVEREFAARAVDYEFFEAVTPATVEATARVLGLDAGRTDLHPLELACLLSHASLWKKAVDERLDHIAVFEDDIHLGDHAGDFLMDSSWIPAQCPIVKLEAFYRKIVVATDRAPIVLPHRRRLLLLDEAHMGGGGYILSQAAARELLGFATRCNELAPVDHIVFAHYPRATGSKIYQMSPALCIQDMHLTRGPTRFPSHLKDVRSVRRGENKEKPNLGLMDKVRRESGRVLKQMRRAVQELTQRFQGRRTMRIRFK
jgi:glycosyl transferase family 25